MTKWEEFIYGRHCDISSCSVCLANQFLYQNGYLCLKPDNLDLIQSSSRTHASTISSNRFDESRTVLARFEIASAGIGHFWMRQTHGLTALYGKGIKTIGQFEQMSAVELMKIYGFGKVSLEEVRRILALFGRFLKNDNRKFSFS